MAEKPVITEIRSLAKSILATELFENPEGQIQVAFEGRLLATIVLECLLPAFDMLLQQQAARVVGVQKSSK